MIVEGLVTSVDSSGALNVAPMGPIVEGDFDKILLRPFQPSTTFNNLSATRCGVFHVVDSVDVIARAAIGQLHELPPANPAHKVNGFVLNDCCRWFEFVVDEVDASEARSRISSTIVHRGERRPFYGFNRARHAVIEAAILATRLHLLPRHEVLTTLQFLQPAVEKTGGETETAAFRLVREFILNHYEQRA